MIVRVVAAGALVVVGAYAIYGFGAGYFSSAGLWLPNPWNIVATALLAIALLWLCARILRR